MTNIAGIVSSEAELPWFFPRNEQARCGFTVQPGDAT